MKTSFLLCILLLTSFTSDKPCIVQDTTIELHSISSKLLNKWMYQYSFGCDTCLTIPSRQWGQMPIDSMVFMKTTPKDHQQHIYKIIAKQRTGNLFEHIKYMMYSQEKRDTVYPVALHVKDSVRVKLLPIVSYGERYKEEWFIHKITTDTLIISTHQVYHQSCRQLRHVYCAK